MNQKLLWILLAVSSFYPVVMPELLHPELSPVLPLKEEAWNHLGSFPRGVISPMSEDEYYTACRNLDVVVHNHYTYKTGNSLMYLLFDQLANDAGKVCTHMLQEHYQWSNGVGAQNTTHHFLLKLQYWIKYHQIDEVPGWHAARCDEVFQYLPLGTDVLVPGLGLTSVELSNCPIQETFQSKRMYEDPIQYTADPILGQVSSVCKHIYNLTHQEASSCMMLDNKFLNGFMSNDSAAFIAQYSDAFLGISGSIFPMDHMLQISLYHRVLSLPCPVHVIADPVYFPEVLISDIIKAQYFRMIEDPMVGSRGLTHIQNPGRICSQAVSALDSYESLRSAFFLSESLVLTPEEQECVDAFETLNAGYLMNKNTPVYNALYAIDVLQNFFDWINGDYVPLTHYEHDQDPGTAPIRLFTNKTRNCAAMWISRPALYAREQWVPYTRMPFYAYIRCTGEFAVQAINDSSLTWTTKFVHNDIIGGWHLFNPCLQLENFGEFRDIKQQCQTVLEYYINNGVINPYIHLGVLVDLFKGKVVTPLTSVSRYILNNPIYYNLHIGEDNHGIGRTLAEFIYSFSSDPLLTGSAFKYAYPLERQLVVTTTHAPVTQSVTPSTKLSTLPSSHGHDQDPTTGLVHVSLPSTEIIVTSSEAPSTKVPATHAPTTEEDSDSDESSDSDDSDDVTERPRRRRTRPASTTTSRPRRCGEGCQMIGRRCICLTDSAGAASLVGTIGFMIISLLL